MAVRTDKLIKLTGIYLDRYNSIGKADLPELLKLGDEFDRIFLTQFIPFLESQLTIAGNVWQSLSESPQITITSGRYLKNMAARIIVDGVNKWLMEPEDKPRAIEFYRSGVDLWKLNREMLRELYKYLYELTGEQKYLDIALSIKFPRKTKLDAEDAVLIEQYIGIFNGDWQNHLLKHIRTVNRFVDTGQMNAWTTEKFIENCTCPDGHIIGYRHGNARMSWHEHLRRFGVARPKILAQAAQQERMGR